MQCYDPFIISTYHPKEDFGPEKLSCFSSSVHVLPLIVTIPRDFYVWNFRDPATPLILSESLVEGGFEPLTDWSMLKNLTTELS